MKETVLMDLAMTIGYRMIRYGAEVYRVEDSLERLFAAYTGRDVHVFSIPSSLLVTYTDESGTNLTQSRRILVRGNNLDRLEQLNALCRWMCRETPDEDVVRAELERIEGRRMYSLGEMILAYAGTSAAFALLFGGSAWDAGTAAVIGAVVRVVRTGLERLHSNEFFCHLVCSWFLVSLAALAWYWGLAGDMDIVIVGTIMTLVPGFTLTGSMRDFIVGDSVAGLVRLVEALLVSAGLAVGTALALYLLRALW